MNTIRVGTHLSISPLYFSLNPFFDEQGHKEMSKQGMDFTCHAVGLWRKVPRYDDCLLSCS